MSRRGAASQGLIALAVLASFLAAPAVAAAVAPVYLIRIEGVINPVTLRLIESALDRARTDGV